MWTWALDIGRSLHARYTGARMPATACQPASRLTIPVRDGPLPQVIILLATDDATYQNATLSRYGVERVAQQADGDILRAQGTQAIWQQAGSDAHEKGVQVVLDTLLLSKCAHRLAHLYTLAPRAREAGGAYSA